MGGVCIKRNVVCCILLVSELFGWCGGSFVKVDFSGDVG